MANKMETSVNDINDLNDSSLFEDVIKDENSCYDQNPEPGLLYRSPMHRDHYVHTMMHLYETKNFSDIKLFVKGKGFKAHKFLLSSFSSYFKGMFTSGLKETHEQHIQIPNIDPCVFESILQFIYTGAIELNDDNVQIMFETSHMMQIHALITGCAGYLHKKMAASNCLGVWKFAIKLGHSRLAQKAYEYALKNIEKISECEEFLEIELSYLLKLLGSDELNVTTEDSVYHMVNKWINHNMIDRKPHLFEVLRYIRFNYVNPLLLKNNVIRNPLITENPKCMELCDSAMNFHLSGGSGSIDVFSLFPRLCTNRESCLLIFGGCESGNHFENEVRSVSIQREGLSQKVASCPQRFNELTGMGYRAILVRKDVFVMTSLNSILWKYNIPCKSWQECPQCPTDVVSHAMVFIGDRIYVLGGYLETYDTHYIYNPVEEICVDDVQEYDIAFNKWECVGKLCRPTRGMPAVVYENQVFLFCGESISLDDRSELDIVQRFDTTGYNCFEEISLPTTRITHAVGHGSKAILFGDGCYVYDLIENTVNARPVCSLPPDLRRFGCFISNNKVYVAGGNYNPEQNLALDEADKYASEIISFPVKSILSGEATSWSSEGTVGKKMMINACVVADIEKFDT